MSPGQSWAFYWAQNGVDFVLGIMATLGVIAWWRSAR